MTEKNIPFWGPHSASTLSPFTYFTAAQWSGITEQRSLLTEQDVQRLRSLGDAISLAEVDHIYLTLSEILRVHVETTQTLFKRRASILPNVKQSTPFIIAIAGSVAVGKSTTARLVQKLISDWPNKPKVDLITTDGFLMPNKILEANNLMQRKGFPESYDRPAMLRFLSDVKAGKPKVSAPVYSHVKYDIDPTTQAFVDRPDILIFEGLNVLQARSSDFSGKPAPLASDFFDFSIYVDAPEHLIKTWYISRFLTLRETAFKNPNSHFSRFANLSDEQATERATELWSTINSVNLSENIRPTRSRADLILRKGKNHHIDTVALRRI